MGKLFRIALEDVVAENPEIIEDISVDEAVKNTEELAQTDAEIQQDMQAVEELMEEKEVLENQVATNDALLENPDATVTAADVEVSEECRNEVYYHLGYNSGVDRIRLSSKSAYNSVKSNPRKYLTISNESIKDTINKIWEKIKAFFKKIWEKIKTFISKLPIYSKLEKNKISKIKEETKEFEKENNGNFVATLKQIAYNKANNESKDIATESNFNSSFIESLYTANPYFMLVLGSGEESEKIIDPTEYQKSYNILTSAIVDIVTGYTKTEYFNIENYRKDIEKGLMFVNRTRNAYILDDIIKCTDFNSREENGGTFHVYGVLKVSGNSITFFGSKLENGGTPSIVRTANFLPAIQAKRNMALEGTCNRKFSLKELNDMLYKLEKTGDYIPTAMDKIIKQYKNCESKMDSIIKELKSSSSEMDNAKAESYKSVMQIYKDFVSPDVQAAYVRSLIAFRKDTITVLKALLAEFKLQARNK